MNRRTALILTVLSSTACNVFDESLYLRADAGSDATVSSLTLSERCSGTVPEIPRVNRDYSLDTSGLADDLRDLASCAGRELPGNDGFFRVHMEAGELWHFHVHTLDRTHNPAIYLLPSCDDRACTRGLDECGDGRDEHISIRARETRDYFVGLDSPSSGGSPYTLTVVHAACGDGEREHGESCDDRNRTSGDGCDDQCRTELGDNGVEVEPNDDFSDPNIVVVNTAAGMALANRDPAYVSRGAGVGYEGTMYLLERGVRVTGTDAWSWDAPFVHTAKKVAETGDPRLIWEGHRAGHDIGYCHIEKLHNLEAIPSTGFMISCFPNKIEGASAGWTRAVAIFED